MTIAILSNVNVTSVAMRANAAAKEEVYCPNGYDTWLQELSDDGSRLYSSGADAVFIILHGPALPLDTEESGKPFRAILEPMIRTIGDAAARHKNMTFVASSLDMPAASILPLYSAAPEPAAAAFWRGEAEKIPLPVLDVAELAADMGRHNFYNKRVWYMGGMPFSKAGEEALASEIANVLRALRGQRKKCLAIDLDNTLWGGAIGELGLDGIHLDRTGSGSRFRDFQKKILELKKSGVILVILSKNNAADAMDGLDKHPDMALRSGDFAAIFANWNPKPQNLIEAAKRLNVGTDSFVFIDDNPVEREMMKMELPEVAVPDFPEDSSRLETFMLRVAREYFLQAKNSGEDRSKTEQYIAEAARREHSAGYRSPEDYLRSLDMRLVVERADESGALRAAQLTRKTNQFNLTTKRYSEAQMREIINSPGHMAYIGELSDRFGGYGKVVLCVAKRAPAIAVIDTFLMSCRAMERGVETAFLRAVEEDMYDAGIRTVYARYVPSGKNSPAEDFWRRAGYSETGRSPDGAVEYMAELPRSGASAEIVKVEKK
jgi:FkbH-like protein